jgi:cell division protease FtsH
MIGNYGMGEELQTFYNENVGSDRNPFLGRTLGNSYKYSENIKTISDKEVLELVRNAYARAKTLLSENKQLVDEIVEHLMEKNTLYAKDVYDLFTNSTVGAE